MAKTRLYLRDRETLLNHARGLIDCPVERAEYLARKADLVALVRPLVEQTFPDREMWVLRKYRLANTQKHVDIRWGDQRSQQAKCPTGEAVDIPVTHNSADEIRLPKPHPIYDAFDRYQTAKDGLNAAKERKLEDYRTLIWSMRNFEDVVAVWPEAAVCAAACRADTSKDNLPSCLTDDVLARIKADVEVRAKASAAPLDSGDCRGLSEIALIPPSAGPGIKGKKLTFGVEKE